MSLAVGNTSVNAGRNNSVNFEARKRSNIILEECPCHKIPNATSKATETFVKAANNFNLEDLLVNICFHFDYPSRWKIIFWWVFRALQSPVLYNHHVLQFPLAWYVNMQRKSSEISSRNFNTKSLWRIRFTYINRKKVA